jgi:hypothetical protein
MQRKDAVVFFASIYYGLGIQILTDVTILISHSLGSTHGLFEPCRYIGYTAAASFLITGTWSKWTVLFSENGGGYRPYDWQLSLAVLLQVGFAYGNAIVYPTELVCGFYISSPQYILERLLLAAPSAMCLACFAELCGWNTHMRLWLQH